MALHHKRGVNESWAHTVDRPARTQAARDARQKRYEQQADPDHRMDPATRAKAARNAEMAHMQRMAEKSVKVRKARKEAQEKGDA
jgi:hypothetical protein